MSIRAEFMAGIAASMLLSSPLVAQEPVAWGTGEELIFHTFSIAGIDPVTGESGVAVTTRNPCVGNGVPWVKVGVGAVATQASTRTEYGYELLDRMEKGMSPQQALDELLADDPGRESRQIGVIGVDGRSAQHGGTSNSSYAGLRSGKNYVTQGNTLAGPEVLDAVARAFEASEGSHRYLADRLIEALNAGHILGGDMRHGESQSAAVIVADPRPNMARRQDGLTVQINVCENPEPLAEMRRIYNTISETLGFRELMQESGNDVFQLKLMLNALGYFRPELDGLPNDLEDRTLYTQEAVDAVDAYREAQPGWRASVDGYVDARMVERMWSQLEEQGKAAALRLRLRDVNRITR